jgi:hypothetical protein
LGNGDGSFQAHQDYATGRDPFSVAVADVNGDGIPDVITADNFSTGTVSVLLGNGDGSFQAPADYATGSNPMFVAAADVNGDGIPDLVTANSSGTVSVLLGTGDGSFRTHQDYSTGGSPSALVVADVNGDGIPDVVTADPNNAVRVLLGNGDGSFQTHRDYATGAGPFSLAVADVNGDGSPDLVTANYYNSTLSILFNRGDGSANPRTRHPARGQARGAIPPRAVAALPVTTADPQQLAPEPRAAGESPPSRPRVDDDAPLPATPDRTATRKMALPRQRANDDALVAELLLPQAGVPER